MYALKSLFYLNMIRYRFCFFVGISGLGFILSSAIDLHTQLYFHRVKHGVVNELLSLQHEQMVARSLLDCSRACARSDICFSIVFNSEDSCFLLSWGIYENLSNPELSEEIEVYTRTSRPCSEIGYLDLSSSGTCFKVLSAKKTQPDAMRECTKDGGYLVQLRTAEKLNMVHNVIKDMPDFGFYIDGSDAIQEDVWVLSDGSPFFMNWNPREPDARFKMSEQCLLLQPDGTYNDMNCTWPFPFICEKQAMPYL